MFRADGIYPVLTLLFSSFSLSFFILFIYLLVKGKKKKNNKQFQAVTYLWFKKKKKAWNPTHMSNALVSCSSFVSANLGSFAFRFLAGCPPGAVGQEQELVVAPEPCQGRGVCQQLLELLQSFRRSSALQTSRGDFG